MGCISKEQKNIESIHNKTSKHNELQQTNKKKKIRKPPGLMTYADVVKLGKRN